MSLVLPVRRVLGDCGNGESGTIKVSVVRGQLLQQFRLHITEFAKIRRLSCDHAAS